MHRRIQNPVKHLRWSVLRKYLTIFAKYSVFRRLIGFLINHCMFGEKKLKIKKYFKKYFCLGLRWSIKLKNRTAGVDLQISTNRVVFLTWGFPQEQPLFEVFLEYTLFLIGNAFFELSLSVAQLFSKLSLKCC